MELLLNELAELFERDLNRLKKEIEEIPDEQLWKISRGITNSCGILAQHLVGNLNHYIGSALGDTGYKRDREKEFSDTGISAEELIADIEDTIDMVNNVLDNLEEDSLEDPYPQEVSEDYTVSQFLFHLYGHFNYHLGQVNYLRRILEKNEE